MCSLAENKNTNCAFTVHLIRFKYNHEDEDENIQVLN